MVNLKNNPMVKDFIMFIIAVTIWSILVSNALALTQDDVFKELSNNDGVNREAEFSIYSPFNLEKSALDFSYNEVCGEVINYEILMWQNCRKTKTEAVKSIKEVCNEIYNNKTEEYDNQCYNTSFVSSYKEVVYYEMDYCETNSIPEGEKDYKLNLNLNFGKCNKGFGYEIDWLPILNTGFESIEGIKWAWFNETWTEKIPLTILCNHNPVCRNELVIYNYSNHTNCDTDLRVVYNDSRFTDFEINETEKLVFFPYNGTFNTSTTLYSLYCDNDGASYGGNDGLVMLYENCVDTSDWVLTEATHCHVDSNSTFDATNRSGYGAVCDLWLSNSGGDNDEMDRFLEDTTDTGTVYTTFFLNIKTATGGATSTTFLTDAVIPGGFQFGLNGNDLEAYGDGGYDEIYALVPLNKWHIMKVIKTYDETDTADYYYDEYFKVNDKEVRTTSWGGGYDRFTHVLEGVTSRSRIDEIIVSRFNISLYPTRYTLTVGASEFVANANPNITTPEIIPSVAFSDTDLNCSATPTDAENNSLVVFFSWAKGENFTGYTAYSSNTTTTNNTLTYASELFTPTLEANATYLCRVRSFDGTLYSPYRNITIVISETPEVITRPSLANFDLSQQTNILILFILVILWIALLVLGHVFHNFVYSATGFIIGMLVGFIFVQIHPIFTLVIVMLNAVGMYSTFIGGN